jgi:thioredoxin reductase (NADPH)
VNVFVVEDAVQTRQELVELLARTPGLTVVGQGGSVREAIEGIDKTTPDALTLDITLPDGSGLEVLKHLRKRRANIHVVVLTGSPYEPLRTVCRRLGAAAVLDKLNGLAQATEALLVGREREFAGLCILAQNDSQDGHRLDDFLDKNHVLHRLIDSQSEYGCALCERLHLESRDLPALITPSGMLLRRPSVHEVARVAGLLRPLAGAEESEVACDLAIVGAGPAGLAAAVYAASDGLKTVVIESNAPGGQAGCSSLIENFFGFPTGISGDELTYRAQLQAHRFGAKFSTPAQALSLVLTESEHRGSLQVEGCNAMLVAKCVIIATGANYHRLEAQGRESFEGSGVYYAATARERQLCRGSTVVVAGGGNSAGQAAMFLSESVGKVLLVIRGEGLTKSMLSYLSRRVEAKANIEILAHTEIRKMMGGRVLEAVELENTKTHERRHVQTSAVFSMIGAKAYTAWLPPEIQQDEKGFIKTGHAVIDAPAWKGMSRSPAPLETSWPGVFAAGDVRCGSVKRCAAAVGEGSIAVEAVHEVLRTYA